MAVFKSGKRRSLNALLRDRRGTSAIEFAIVFPVFMTIMMSSFEVGWFYFVNATVDAATINIAREIRTGQIRGDQTFDPDQFFADEVCPKLDYFGECDTRLTAEVMVFDTFADLASDTSPLICRDDLPEVVDQIVVDPGTENSIIRIRICLIYDTLNPAIGINLSGNSAGERRVTSTYVFRNEPFLQNQPGGATS